MNTSLLIVIGHPDDTTADGLIDHAIKPSLNDISADSGYDWSVTTVDDARERSVRTAIGLTLSEFPEDLGNDWVLDAILNKDERIVVWETFEHWDVDDIVGYIKNTAEAIYSTYF